MMSRIEELFSRCPQPSPTELNDAFWQACHGGQRRAAEYLHARGANLNWIPEYAKTTALEIAAAPDTGREALVTWLREKSASESKQSARDGATSPTHSSGS
jgi:uncharacterized protein